MKRMFVTLSIIFLLFISAAIVLGQMVTVDKDVPQFDRMKRRMELREEMHRRMMNKVLHGIGPDDDLFKDMEQLLNESVPDMPQLGTANFETDWQSNTEGRTLFITPKNKEQNFDIDVSNRAITIRGKSEKKTAQGISVSQFSNVFSIPDDCDEAKVKIAQKEGSILVAFPYKIIKGTATPSSHSPQKKHNRVPLPPVKNGVTI